MKHNFTFSNILRRDARGVATVEFALVSVLFFGTLTVALDFGIFVQQRLRLGSAVEQGAMIAYSNAAAMSTAQVTSIKSYISSTAALPTAITTTVECNGSTTCDGANPTSMCVAAGPTFTSPTSGACADGSTPGYYMRIRSASTYQAVVVPNKWLSGKSMAAEVVVRLS